MRKKKITQGFLQFTKLTYARNISWVNCSRKIFVGIFFTGIFISGILFLGGCRNGGKLNSEIHQKSSGNNQEESSLKKNEIYKLVKILFVGDMMFDRHIRTAVEKYGQGNYDYIFEPIKDKLTEYDLIVGNLEGPITDRASTSVGTVIGEKKNFIFTFDPAVAKALSRNNIKLVNIGNNHILNQGREGLERTKKYLDEVGVEYFGDENFSIREIGGIKIGFVGYNYSSKNSLEKALREIGSIRNEVDFVAVCPHWGMEYKTGDPGEQIKVMARRFIDAGADVVIGTHPHVVQIKEEYKGKKIYYSLGNFVFDQYFQKETMNGLGVELTINPDWSLQYKEMKFVMNKRGQTEPK